MKRNLVILRSFVITVGEVTLLKTKSLTTTFLDLVFMLKYFDLLHSGNAQEVILNNFLITQMKNKSWGGGCPLQRKFIKYIDNQR